MKPLLMFSIFLLFASLVNAKMRTRKRYRKPVIHYPKDTMFWVTDFFVRGCKNFLEKCPSSYKSQLICGRNYNGQFKDFANYCEMQYENCNTWRNWRVFKRQKC